MAGPIANASYRLVAPSNSEYSLLAWSNTEYSLLERIRYWSSTETHWEGVKCKVMNGVQGMLGNIFRESFRFSFLIYQLIFFWLGHLAKLSGRGTTLYRKLFFWKNPFSFSVLCVCPGFSSPGSMALLLSSCRLPPASPAPPVAYPNTPAF